MAAGACESAQPCVTACVRMHVHICSYVGDAPVKGWGDCSSGPGCAGRACQVGDGLQAMCRLGLGFPGALRMGLFTFQALVLQLVL